MNKKRRLEIYEVCKDLATMEVIRMTNAPLHKLKEWYFHYGYVDDKLHNKGYAYMEKEDYNERSFFFELLYHSTINPQYRILK